MKRPAIFLVAMAASFLLGALFFYLMRPGIVPVREAAFRGAIVCICYGLVEGIARAAGKRRWIVRGMAVALMVLLIPLIAGLHPLRTVPKRTPAAFGLPFEDVRFASADGVKLAAWLIPHPRPRGNVIFCHGHGRNRGHVAGLLTTFHDLGLNVLAFDFRGHGDSEGHTSTFGYREVDDLYAAEAFLREKCPEQPLFLAGVSLGAAVSLRALPQLPHVRGVWSEGAFARLDHAVDHKFALLPTLLRRPLIHGYYGLGWLDAGLWGGSVDTRERWGKMTTSVFFCHATLDDLVPFTEGQLLFESYTGPKESWWVEGASHYDVRQRNHEEYPRRLRRFIESCLEATP